MWPWDAEKRADQKDRACRARSISDAALCAMTSVPWEGLDCSSLLERGACESPIRTPPLMRSFSTEWSCKLTLSCGVLRNPFQPWLPELSGRISRGGLPRCRAAGFGRTGNHCGCLPGQCQCSGRRVCTSAFLLAVLGWFFSQGWNAMSRPLFHTQCLGRCRGKIKVSSEPVKTCSLKKQIPHQFILLYEQSMTASNQCVLIPSTIYSESVLGSSPARCVFWIASHALPSFPMGVVCFIQCVFSQWKIKQIFIWFYLNLTFPLMNQKIAYLSLVNIDLSIYQYH